MNKTSAGATGPNEHVCFTDYGMAMIQSESPMAAEEVAKAWDEYKRNGFQQMAEA